MSRLKNYSGSEVAKRWKELSGENNWEGLLDPLDTDLRHYLIHYGELTQATYDAFNSERASKYAGSCRFARPNLFTKVGLHVGFKPLMKYRVVRYFYAMSQINLPEAFIIKSLSREAWSKESNWMGFIAVATDEGKAVLGRRDVVIAWRGTIQVYEWFKDFDFPLVSASGVFGDAHDARVHRGWLSLYTSADSRSSFSKDSARDQVLSEVKRIVNEYKDEEMSISITGHSLGASLALLNAADLVANKIAVPANTTTQETAARVCPVTVFSFSSPRVGDANFRRMVRSLKDLKVLQVRNVHDIVPSLPPWYAQVGEQLLLDSLQSSFLKIPGDVMTWHILEVILHVIAGTQGSGGGFKLEIERDISLVNKSCDALRDEHQVPAHWWCANNKGMVQMSDGSWKLDDHDNDG